jgi:hypothetical protein
MSAAGDSGQPDVDVAIRPRRLSLESLPFVSSIGREAVTFLVRVKKAREYPARVVLGLRSGAASWAKPIGRIS